MADDRLEDSDCSQEAGGGGREACKRDRRPEPETGQTVTWHGVIKDSSFRSTTRVLMVAGWLAGWLV